MSISSNPISYRVVLFSKMKVPIIFTSKREAMIHYYSLCKGIDKTMYDYNVKNMFSRIDKCICTTREYHSKSFNSGNCYYIL